MSKIELSDYLTDTLHEAKRLLQVRSELGRIPISKENIIFKQRIHRLIDDWFQRGEIPACRKSLIQNQESSADVEFLETYPESDCIVNYSNLAEVVGEFGPSGLQDSFDVGGNDNDDVLF
jgi:hypothetical protein